MRHRDAWAIEKKAPHTTEKPSSLLKEQPRAARHGPAIKAVSSTPSTSVDGEVLVVASKVKAYIRDLSGMNTSAGVMDRLTDKIRRICDGAIRNAKREGRKTVLDRDID